MSVPAACVLPAVCCARPAACRTPPSDSPPVSSWHGRHSQTSAELWNTHLLIFPLCSASTSDCSRTHAHTGAKAMEDLHLELLFVIVLLFPSCLG